MTDNYQVQGLFNQMEKIRDDLREHIHSIMWNMRGSLSREEAWSLCNDERISILKQIEERVKQIDKTGLPIM